MSTNCQGLRYKYKLDITVEYVNSKIKATHLFIGYATMTNLTSFREWTDF